MKKLSIIIPYYNTLKYTKKLFEKLEPQLTNEVEVILVDDGCNEKELDKLKAKVIHLPIPSGNASKPRNVGLDNAKGEYIAFIDSDDNIEDDYIKTIIESTKKDWDYCYISWDWKNGKIIINDEPPKWNTCVWNCIYKRELIGNARFDCKKNIAEDENFNKKVRRGKKHNILKVLYHYNAGREGSLTTRFSKGEISKENIKCGLLVYQKYISKIGGIESFLYNFFKSLHKYYDIMFVYKDGDEEQLKRYKKYVKCIKYNNQTFICDKYLCVSNQDNIADNVISLSGEYYDMIHADFTAMNWKYKTHKKTTKHIAVSNVAKKSIELQDDRPCVVIYNLLEMEEVKKPLMIMSAQRLSVEKGGEEAKLFARKLKEKNIPFIWLCFTDNKNGEEDGIIFKQYVLDIENYFGGFDYFASFSRTESYGYSIVQAMSYGLPLIVRDIPVLDELKFKDGVHGYKINYDMSNIDEVIDKLTKKPKCIYNKLDDYNDWLKELGELNKYNNYEEERDMKVKVIATKKFEGIRDAERNVYPKAGDEWETTKERAEFLQSKGVAEIIEEIQPKKKYEEEVEKIIDKAYKKDVEEILEVGKKKTTKKNKKK